MACKLMQVFFGAFVLILTDLAGNRAQWTRIEQNRKQCQTPDRTPGTCIPIDTCKPVKNFLDNVPQPLPVNVRHFLQILHCGFDGKTPKVCCSENLIFPKITQGNPSVPSPPDVSNHIKINRLPYDCGILDTSQRVVNGNITGVFEFPWMALLWYKTAGGPKFNCGGTIINERYILTAAHCITHLRDPLLKVRVGEHNIDTPIDCETTQEGNRICAPPYRDLAIEEIIPHSAYNRGSGANDIGLLRVSPIDFSFDNIKPICLPVNEARNYDFTEQRVLVIGWGFTELGTTSSILLKTDIPMVPLNECQKIYAKHFRKITHFQLCAGGDTKSDTCQGDSGGPLHVLSELHSDHRFVQHGIVSFGPEDCGISSIPGIYTAVAYYMDWILENIRP